MCKVQYAYSIDGETYVGTYDSINEARLEASCYDEYKTIWVGTIAHPDPAEGVSVDWIIEHIEENIGDEFWWLDVDDFIDVTDIDVFESKIKTAIREHITPKVFSVKNTIEYKPLT